MNPGATLADLVEFDENTAITWRTGTKIAPFDQEVRDGLISIYFKIILFIMFNVI